MSDPYNENLQDIPLVSNLAHVSSSGAPSQNFSHPRSARVTNVNPNETYARYEQAPFRQYSERCVPDVSMNRPTIKKEPSKSSLLHRMLSRQSKLENTVRFATGDRTASGGAGAGHPQQYGNDTADFDYSAGQSKTGKHGPKPAYSLAGPRDPPPTDQYRSYQDPSYHGYDDEGSDRPKPQWGLSKPFPRVSRKQKKSIKRGRGSGKGKESGTGHPEGQVGGGPGGHHRSPVRGQPLGEAPGGPAGVSRNPEDEDESGHTNFVEHFADGLTGPSALSRGNSDDTLTESTDGDEEEEIPNFWFGIRRKIREPLAEWLGTMVAVLIGVCANLQVKTSDGQAGSFTQEAAMWGLGTMMAIYIAGGISGAHCNPMVSIFLSVFRGFPARKCLIYICAQVVGAICAVWIAFGIYKDAILSIDPKLTSDSKGTGKAFFTLPAEFATPVTAFFTDFTSAAVMGGTVLALGDDTNAPPGAGMHAFILGLIGFAMASTLGYNTGPQTNPAKDLATRLVPYWVGYGADMWVQGWWAEAWCAAIFGGLFGCLVYDIAIFEGPESPINYPRVKRRKARAGSRKKWLKTGLFGANKKAQAKQDLEEGSAGIMEKGRGRQLDGH